MRPNPTRMSEACRAYGGRGIRLILSGLPALLLVSCFTTREEVSEVRTSFSVDDGYWGADDDTSKNADDSDQIRSRFADAGWKVSEDGEMTARDSNLYREDRVERGKTPFGKDESRWSGKEAETKSYDTPEFLDRKLYSTNSAREGKDRGLFGNDRAGETGRMANTDPKDGFLSGLNPFKTGSARESGDSFRTSEFRPGSRARSRAAIPTSVSQGELGYYSDSVTTLDDVKRMLNPEAFD